MNLGITKGIPGERQCERRSAGGDPSGAVRWAADDGPLGCRGPGWFRGPAEEQRRIFYRVYAALDNRIRLFTSLPLGSIDKLALQHRLDEIGRELPE